MREPLLDAALAAEDAIGGRSGVFDSASLASAWREERRNLAAVMSYADYAKATAGVKAALAAPALIDALPGSEDALRQRLTTLSDALHTLLAVARDRDEGKG